MTTLHQPAATERPAVDAKVMAAKDDSAKYKFRRQAPSCCRLTRSSRIRRTADRWPHDLPSAWRLAGPIRHASRLLAEKACSKASVSRGEPLNGATHGLDQPAACRPRRIACCRADCLGLVRHGQGRGRVPCVLWIEEPSQRNLRRVRRQASQRSHSRMQRVAVLQFYAVKTLRPSPMFCVIVMHRAPESVVLGIGSWARLRKEFICEHP